MSEVKVTPSNTRSCPVETPLLAESAHSNVDKYKRAARKGRGAAGEGENLCLHYILTSFHVNNCSYGVYRVFFDCVLYISSR